MCSSDGRQSVIAVILVVTVFFSLGVGSVGAQAPTEHTIAYPDAVDENELHLVTSQTGSTDLVLVYKYSLTETAEKEGFTEAQSSATLQDRIVADFETGVKNMANNTESAVASDVHSSYIDMYRYQSSSGEVGVAEVGVTWDDLASVSDGTLTLTEPYRGGSGVEASTLLIVTAPDGSSVSQATPTPTVETATNQSVAWGSGTDLSRFKVTIPVESAETTGETSPETTAETTPEDSAPGFTPLAGLVSLLIATTTLIGLRRQKLE